MGQRTLIKRVVVIVNVEVSALIIEAQVYIWMIKNLNIYFIIVIKLFYFNLLLSYLMCFYLLFCKINIASQNA
jgi:hypothetical protein